MVFNGTFYNVLVISWRLVFLVEETVVPGKTINLSQVTDKPRADSKGGGTPGARPTTIEKNMIVLLKIVICQTKYPNRRHYF